MSGLRVVAGYSLMVLVLIHCGGHTASSSSGSSSGNAVGGAGGGQDECAGASSEGGCDGAAGERALEEYARLHTACSLNVRVNRRGKPVCIDYHIR